MLYNFGGGDYMDKNYMVTKSNALITASYDLTAHEQKLILTLASLVQPKDEDFKAYNFKISEFMAMLDVSNRGRYGVCVAMEQKRS